MSREQSVNIRAMSSHRAEQVGYYRFLDNENVMVSELVQSAATHCQQQVGGLHVLAISDSSEINLQGQVKHLKAEGLGVVGNNQDVGFFLHPTLVTNAKNGFPLGLSTIQLWHRRSYPSRRKNLTNGCSPLSGVNPDCWPAALSA